MDKVGERQVRVIVEIAISVVAFGFGIWAVYYEFGSDVFNHPILAIIFTYLGILGYVLFRMRWAEAKKKTTDEKVDDLDAKIDKLITNIDDLITEIRSDRAQGGKK